MYGNEKKVVPLVSRKYCQYAERRSANSHFLFDPKYICWNNKIFLKYMLWSVTLQKENIIVLNNNSHFTFVIV